MSDHVRTSDLAIFVIAWCISFNHTNHNNFYLSPAGGQGCSWPSAGAEEEEGPSQHTCAGSAPLLKGHGPWKIGSSLGDMSVSLLAVRPMRNLSES
jgi:hypothetical protein